MKYALLAAVIMLNGALLADRTYQWHGYKSACSYGACFAYTIIVLPLEQTALNQKIRALLDQISQKGSKAKDLADKYRKDIQDARQQIAKLQQQLADCITGN